MIQYHFLKFQCSLNRFLTLIFRPLTNVTKSHAIPKLIEPIYQFFQQNLMISETNFSKNFRQIGQDLEDL